MPKPRSLKSGKAQASNLEVWEGSCLALASNLEVGEGGDEEVVAAVGQHPPPRGVDHRRDVRHTAWEGDGRKREGGVRR